MIQEFCNLIEQEAHLVISNHKWQSEMLPRWPSPCEKSENWTPWSKTQGKKSRYYLILSRDIDDQRSLQSDWMRGTYGYTQPKEVILEVSFPWLLSPCKKCDMDWFLPEVLMSEESSNSIYLKILGHKWRTRFFPEMRLSQNYKKHCYAPFLRYKKNINGSHFWQKPKKLFGRAFWPFSPT